MNIIIRADASTAIGTGHVMRCLALARILRDNRADVSFICREEAGNLIALIVQNGFPVHRLPAGAGPAEDGAKTRSVLETADRTVDWLIVDHYDLDAAYESAQRPHASRIMVIDDLANRSHDCDLLLDQNYGASAERYVRLIPPHCMQALGPQFAIVRSEFRQIRTVSRNRTGKIHRILISLGGSDSTNETAKVLHALELLTGSGLSIDVAIGVSSTHQNEIVRLAAGIPGIRCHVNLPTLAPLMEEADLAIGAGGSTMWERCCVGLPTLAITIADNQTAATEALARDGYILFAGAALSVTEHTLRRDLEFLMAHPEVVQLLAARCRSLVDGKGSERIVRLLSAAAQPIVVRPAVEADSGTIFDWRNDPSVLNASFDPRPLQWDAHRQWLAETLRSPDRVLLIADMDGRPVGVLRYDFQGAEAVVSLYLDPERTGIGIGPDILRKGSEWIRLNRRTVRKLIARVKPGNEVSARAFRKAGFEEHHRSFQRIFAEQDR